MSAQNITHDSPTRGPARPMPYVISGVMLALAVIMPLVVPMYAHDGPRLFSFPFFYWYQMAWVPVCALLVGIAYKLTTAEDKRRRAAVTSQSSPNGTQSGVVSDGTNPVSGPDVTEQTHGTSGSDGTSGPIGEPHKGRHDAGGDGE
ncbi:DUF3311 domain-containing protein [Arthrobacter cryoconiti]|uniref:DUF3311 domain-containing protein n=1 Tax=Arthrobacter cryoconiti TaxID=748907 RepID=A0ABV8QXL5_9MICC|nr:DUF3311 domain-containing protein [Arthrobacter cryoconiti]MCC9067665.1 DUF3311 domain-containing protein [Arthrobacter cryoconiti]